MEDDFDALQLHLTWEDFGRFNSAELENLVNQKDLSLADKKFIHNLWRDHPTQKACKRHFSRTFPSLLCDASYLFFSA
jgi:hypothetical protein